MITGSSVLAIVSGRSFRLVLMAGLVLLLFAPVSDFAATPQSSTVVSPSESAVSSDLDESTPWWNVSYHYRRYVNLTDTNSTPRVDVPINMQVSFDNNTCYKNSIRVVTSGGVVIPSQPYSFIYWEDTDYVKSATVFWYANISKSSTATFWIYYSEDKSIEPATYQPVVWFARTTGTLSGKFSPNYWSFRGSWYNVTMYNAAGGKMTKGAHKLASGTWNWDWGTNQGSMHWNPDGLGGGGTSGVPPVPGTTFVNREGPLFINYTTQVLFGSYAKMNVTYTFYKWGWTFRTWIQYTGSVTEGGRTDEWVFYPYITTHGIEVSQAGAQTYYDNWAQSGNKGKPAGFGWWNDNGMSHGTVRISHDSRNTNPAYPNNYDNYYYRWWDQGSYEFWDTVIPTVYAQAGTVLEETCAIAVWNGAEGLAGYMRVFNATSRYLPILRSMGNVSSYSFRINVRDLGGANVQGANVTLFDVATGQKLLKADGQPYSDLTNSDGNVTFIGLINKTYRITSWIDSRTWLNEQSGATGMNVTWTGDRAATGPFTPVAITLELASIRIHLRDLRGYNMATVGSETVQVRVYNTSDSVRTNWKYMDQHTTDLNGEVRFFRVPRAQWTFNFSYSDTDTGHIYQWGDLARYCSYRILESDIVADLSMTDWVLPLVTLDFNMKAYDGSNVGDAYVRISKRGTGDPITVGRTDYFNITHMTDASGDVTFYRVLNGTWTVYSYKSDDFGQLAFNGSQSVANVQSYQSKQMVLPLTSLRVLVVDNSLNRVPGAEIEVYANGELLTTAYSDTSGWYNFTYIKANDTAISWSYTATVRKVGVAAGPQAVYASYDFHHYNRVTLEAFAYSGMYTELNCTISTTVIWYYGNNMSFTVGWYNRTGSVNVYVDEPLGDYDAGWLNFTIRHGATVVGSGTWNGTAFTHIVHNGDGSVFFAVAIYTIGFSMDVSSIPYLIEIDAHAPGYSDPNTYTVTVIMMAASTTLKGASTGSTYWSDGFSAVISLNTAPLDRPAHNLTGLTYANYTIYDSLEFIEANRVSSGSLVHTGNGLYRFSDATLNSSDAGTYYVFLWLFKHNYVNQTHRLTVTVNMIQTSFTWLNQPDDYTWGAGSSFAELLFRDLTHGQNITTPDTVTVYWINQQTGQTVVIDHLGALSYTFPKNIVANGTWRIQAHVTKANFVSHNELSMAFDVLSAQTEIVMTSPVTQTVEWGRECAEFDFTYMHMPVGTLIPGARLLDVSWTGEAVLIDNGDGTYRLRLLAVQEASNYTVGFVMWIANRTEAMSSITVNALIPLELTAEKGFSLQNPIREYWTHEFTVSVVAGDLSNQSVYVPGVTVTYQFAAGGILGGLTENVTGRYYWFSFAASSTPGPGVYEVVLSASRAGCSSTSTLVYVEIMATPTRASAQNMLLTVYYADAFLLNFTWVAEIDGGAGITNPDDVLVQLWKGAVLMNPDVGGVSDLGDGSYQFLMDTHILAMGADSPVFPTIYYFVVTISKLGYQTPLAVTVIVLVMQTPTQMTADSVEPVIWSDDISVRVDLRDLVHDEYVWLGATVLFTYGSFSSSFSSLGNGTFIITLASDDVFSASGTPYTAVIGYSLPNYLAGSVQVAIRVNPMPAHIVILDQPEDHYDWNETFGVRFQIMVNSTSTVIRVTTAYYYWTQYLSVNGTLTYNPIGWYEGTVDTGHVPAGDRVLRLAALRNNYTMPAVDVSILVHELSTTLSVNPAGPLVEISGVDTSETLRLDYAHSGTNLQGAIITFLWAGLERTASWSAGQYVFDFNPSADASLAVPGVYRLNFTARLANYTTQTASIVLRLVAATAVTGGPFRVEAEQTLLFIFQYWDITNSRAVGTSATVYYQIGGGTPVAVTPGQFDGQKYTVQLAASDIGMVSRDPYQIRIIAYASGYQNWTESEVAQYITLYVDPPTVDLLLFRVERNTLFLVLIMIGAFVTVGLIAVGVQRMRIPFQIKQIDKAISNIEKGRKTKVEGLKTMGKTVSELLAPGLADLGIEAPIIDYEAFVSREEEEGFETEQVLEGLEVLEAVGAPEEAAPIEKRDFETELAAELEAIKEVIPKAEKAAPLVAEIPPPGEKPEVEEVPLAETPEVETPLLPEEPKVEEAVPSEMPEVETPLLPEEPKVEEAAPSEMPEAEKPLLPEASNVEEISEPESGPEVKEAPPSEQKDAGQGETDTESSADSPSSSGQTARAEPEPSAREGDEGQAPPAQDTGEEPQ